MSERRVLLAAATFMDSPHAIQIMGAPTEDIRKIVTRFLNACIIDAGKPPNELDAEEFGSIMREVLPRRYGVRDPLAAATEEVLQSYLTHLDETEVVTAMFELRLHFDEHMQAFRDAVQSGTAHADGVAITGKGKTFVHKADKTQRNDPCPCGSGKKFKKCCGK